jgi:hypothetical protein
VDTAGKFLNCVWLLAVASFCVRGKVDILVT